MMAENGVRRAGALAVGLAAAAFSLFAVRTPFTTLWDRDEPRFAQAAVEMVASGNLLFPTFGGQLRAHKPILVYWLMAGPVRLFGASEWTVRLVSCLAAALAGLLTWSIGRRLFSSRTGFWAMGGLLSTLLVFVEGSAATADALLLACLTAAAAAFAAQLDDSRRRWPLVALALATGAAQLAKGPVGLTIPVLAIGATLLLGQEPGRGRAAVRASLAILGGCAVFLAWAIPANLATEGRFLTEGFGRHVVGRALEPMEGHGGRFLLALPYYVPVVLLGFMPWTLHLPGAISAVLGGRVGGPRGRAFLVGWSVPTLVLFSLVATKLPHYALPVFPALALAVGATLEAARAGALSPRDVAWLRRGAWLFAPLAAGQAAALAALPFVPELGLPRGPFLAVAVLGLAVAAAALGLHGAGRYEASAGVLLAGALVVQTVAAVWLLPALEPLKPVPRLAAAIRARTLPDEPVATYGFEEPSLDFYLNRPPLERLGNDEMAAAWARRGGLGVLVTTREALRRLSREGAAGRLSEIGSVRGLNVAKGEWCDLVAAERRSPP